MKGLSRRQKTVLIVLAILDVSVIAGLAGIVIHSIRTMQAIPVAPMPTATVGKPLEVPTWTMTVEPTISPTLPPRATNTATPTPTPFPTRTPTPTSTPRPLPTAGPVPLDNASFDYILPNRIPGWKWYAYVNYKSGATNPETSFAEPVFTVADDSVRQISGSTLKVETVRWLKFRTWVHQTVTVTAGSTVQFSIKANAFSSTDRLIVKAGVDPTGQPHCDNAQWGETWRINQDDGIITLTSPRVVVAAMEDKSTPTPMPTLTPDPLERETPAPVEPEEETEILGKVTICFYAEPAYPHINNAAFFDQAQLIAVPPR